MARVRLASWYDGHAPGDTVDIPDEMLRPLTRDGRVAEVLPPVEPVPEPVQVAEPEPATSPEPPPEPPEPGRRSRRNSGT